MKWIWLALIVYLAHLKAERCTKLDQYCNCDIRCREFGDCCLGHNYYNKTGLLSGILSCKSFAKNAFSNMWIVDKCQNPEHSLSDLCMKTKTNHKVPIKSYIPVLSDNNLIYENVYCARCNGENKYRFLNISIECVENKIISFQEANQLIKDTPSKCRISNLINNIDQRQCMTDLIRSCPNKENHISESTINCENGSISIHTDGVQKFKNKHCCECWNVSCLIQINSVMYEPDMFSYLLDFNEWNDDNEHKSLVNVNSTDKTDKTNKTESKIVNNLIFFSSFTFTIFSMISLSFLIMLYTTQRVFHNFGGYLTICLGLCLWLMNFFTLLVTSTSVSMSLVCKYIAIFQHFIALSTFVWMAVYALDLLQTFGIKSTNMGKKKSLKTFCLYCATGFGCVTMLVGTSTIVDYSLAKNSTIRPKYGGAHCWFTNKIGGIVWYFAPVCLLLLWNFGSCVIVFYRLIQTANECRVVQRKESNSTLWLCIRLTAVFGIGYIFQIFAILTNVRALIIIGSLINCLQGCLLTFCFLWAKRVRAVVSNTWSSLSENYGKSTNTGSTSRTQNTNLNDDENVQITLTSNPKKFVS